MKHSNTFFYIVTLVRNFIPLFKYKNLSTNEITEQLVISEVTIISYSNFLVNILGRYFF